MFHSCKQEQKRPAPVWWRLSRTHPVSCAYRNFGQFLRLLFPFISEQWNSLPWPPVSLRLRYCRQFLAGPFQQGVSGMKVRNLVVHSNFSAFHRTSVFVVRLTYELSSIGTKWVPRLEMACIPTRWASALSGTDVQAPWHGVLETVWLLCEEAQQDGCLRA